MATAVEDPIRLVDPDVRLVLDGIRWSTYEALLCDLERSHVRLTYNRGMLELMSPGQPHEHSKRLLGRMVEALTEELVIDIYSAGSTTFRRALKEKGLEPDECYWVANEPRIRGKREVDLDVDPPPDLAIEVEMSSPLLDKLEVYAGLGFPEVWAFDGMSIRVAVRQPDGAYYIGDRSHCFPWLSLADLVRFHDLSEEGMGETAWIRAFRVWVRDELAPIRDAWAP